MEFRARNQNYADVVPPQDFFLAAWMAYPTIQLRRAALFLKPAELMAVLALLFAVVATAGILDQVIGIGRFVDLDREANMPTAVSAGLTLVAVGLGLLVASATGLGLFKLFALMLLWIAVDNTLGIHERLESALSIDWQLLYAPFLISASVTGLLLAGRLSGRVRVWFLLAGLAWGVAAVLEFVDNGLNALANPAPLVAGEELLELLGAALFVLAFFTEVQRTAPSELVDKRLQE